MPRSAREPFGNYRKDQIVFSQGDPADAVFFIQEGKVKVTVVSEQGKEAIVAILGANDFFGEACLAGQARRIAAVTAMARPVDGTRLRANSCATAIDPMVRYLSDVFAPAAVLSGLLQ